MGAVVSCCTSDTVRSAKRPSVVQVSAYLGVLRVRLLRGRALLGLDPGGNSDPYVEVVYGSEKERSSVVRNTRSPTWNYSCRFLVTPLTEECSVTLNVFDWDRMSSDDYIGSVEVSTAQVLAKPKATLSLTLMLTDMRGEHKGKHSRLGEVDVELSFMPKKEMEIAFWKGLCQHFDTNGSGAIDLLELSLMVAALQSPITKEELSTLYSEIDQSKDGKVSWSELKAWAESSPENLQRLTGSRDTICKVFLAADTAEEVGAALLDDGRADSKESSAAIPGMTIMVRDRITGKSFEERIPSSIMVAMRLIYSPWSVRVADTQQVKRMLARLTESQGRHYNDPRSKASIPEFVKYHKLNMAESLEPVEAFVTFNEFFYRKLKPGARIIDESPVVSAADCRLSAFATITDATKIWIKGQDFTVSKLLQCQELAELFPSGSSVLIFRLSPQDYHRFHSPVTGTLGPNPREIPGSYFTVNPVAVRENIDVFGENKRVVTWIDCEDAALG
eukprot:RCo026635